MSKYQLENLLNEISGTGRIGTYLATYRELVNKMDELEEKGIRVKELGRSGDGKTAFEFEVYPGDKDEAFSVYPYKFNPEDEDDMQELPFSIGGKPVAIRVAKELLGQGAMSTAEVRASEDEFKETGDTMPAGFGESEKKELPQSIKDKEARDAEIEAKKAKGMMKEANEDYDLLKIKKEIRFHLDTYEKGIIDGDDLAQAVEEVVFGEIKAPGMRENGHVDDYEEEIAEADVDVDLVKATAAKANNQINNAAGMADFILDVIGQIGEKEQEAILNNNNIKQAIAFLEKAKTPTKEGHAMQGVEAELESGEIGNMDALAEVDNVEVVTLLNKVRKHLVDKFDRKYNKPEFDLYIDSLERDIKRGEFDGVESLSMKDHEIDFEEYIRDKMTLEENKALKEHFSRFMFKKYS